MQHSWRISKKDIELTQQVCEQQSFHKIFKERERINIKSKKIEISKELLWKNIFTCLLTTQQRSTEESRINQFIKNGYSAISLTNLSNKKNIEKYICEQLKGFGGIRRSTNIPNEASTIYNHLKNTEWELLTIVNSFGQNKGDKILRRQRERELCNQIVLDKEFKGLGPKQARNLLQMLGLTIYEIPIDSRVTDWLNDNEIFPFKLNSKGLSDIEFYCFLNDAIILLCEKAGTKPCLFDAAVFSLKEKKDRANKSIGNSRAAR
jgi:hypothetical protein